MNVYKTGDRPLGIMVSLLVLCFISACDPAHEPTLQGRSDQFETTPQKFNITPGIIDEASGLTESASISGYLWTLQDSGKPSSLYLVSKDGQNIKEYNIPGSANHDWEDIASGPGSEQGVNYIYIGEIGNNNLPLTETNIIYRIPEISDINGSFDGGKLDKIQFKYPDGPRDAETLILDPVTRDLFVISKEAGQTGIYRLPYPQSATEIIIAEKIGIIPSATTATGGSITTDGAEIVVRTYTSVYYWNRKEGETVGQTLARNASKILSVVIEPQGEGICFDRQLSGFYTLSEKGNSSGVSLNYYKRK